MPGVKTAISLDPDLFQQVCKMAEKMDISRSRLFALAMKDYLHNLESRQFLVQLNEVYSDEPDAEDIAVATAMRQKHRKALIEKK